MRFYPRCFFSSLLDAGNAESLEAFQTVWQDMAAKIRGLAARDPASDWAKELNQAVAVFEKALPPSASGPISEEAMQDFKLFTAGTNKQFYNINKELHARCRDIIKLSQPLQRMLKKDIP